MQIFPVICFIRIPFRDDQRHTIRNALVNPVHEFVSTPFRPKHHCRGTVEHFFVFEWVFFLFRKYMMPTLALFSMRLSDRLSRALTIGLPASQM